MADVKISQLPEVTSLAGSDVLPSVAYGATSKITLQNLAGAMPQVSSSISASYALTASYALNGSANTKFWITNQTYSLAADETLLISDNYVAKNSLLILTASSEEYIIPNINFSKKSQIFIGGSLLLVDSNIINDGILSVAGVLILSGSSTITGNGIII